MCEVTIICESFNGWPVSRDRDEIQAVTFEVSGVPDRRFTTVKAARPLFAYLIRRFHLEVDKLTGGTYDEWSYHVRPARTQDAGDPPRSNHGSATAVDLDATEFPRGRTNMTAAQRAVVRDILAELGGVIAWGGDFQQAHNKDEMHFEVAPGVSMARVLSQVSKMRLDENGVRVPLPPVVRPPAPAPKPQPDAPGKKPVVDKAETVRIKTLHTGVRGTDVRIYQRHLRPLAARLGINVARINPNGATGFYGKETAALTRAVYKALAAKGGDVWLRGDLTIPGSALLKKLGLKEK